MINGARAHVEHEVGAFDEGTAYLDRMLDSARKPEWGAGGQSMVAAYVPPIMRIAGSEEHLAAAEVAIEAGLFGTDAHPITMDTPVITRMLPNIGLAFIAIQRRDVASAENSYAWFMDWQGTCATFVGTAVDRLLGLLSAVLGRLDDARDHFEDALVFCEPGGYRPEYALDCLRLRRDPSRPRQPGRP